MAFLFFNYAKISFDNMIKKRKSNKLLEFYGWYAVFAVLAAYFLVSFGVVTAHSLIYQLLNLTGGLGLALIAFSKKDIQPAITNGVWALIALIALVNIYFSF